MSKHTKRKEAKKEDLSRLKSDKLSKAEELLCELLDERLGDDGSFEDYEEEALKIGNEIVRRRLEKKLQTMADEQPQRVCIDHNNDWHGYRKQTAFNCAKHLPGAVTYHSLVGSLRISRYTYRECRRAGSIYVLLELQAGLIERMTPALARAAALGFADMPTRRLTALIIACGRAPPSRATLERCASDVGSYAVATNEQIETSIRAKEVLPQGVERIVLGLDRTAVPMRPSESALGKHAMPDDLRRSRPKGDVSIKGPVAWHMDYVGTVGFLDKDGKRVASRQYRVPFNVDPQVIAKRMLSDTTRALRQRPALQTTVVQDGAPEMWKVMTKALAASRVRRWHEVLDFYHLDERLGKCLDVIIADQKSRAAQRQRWRRQLLETADGIQRVIASVKRFSRRANTPQRAELKEHIRYMQKQKARARYAHLRQRGIPIGSGITEGACKSLVGMRAKRSGQRWSQRGLTAALHLRSIIHSDRFDAFWHLFAQRYRATAITSIT